MFTNEEKRAIVDLLANYFPLKSDTDKLFADFEKKIAGDASKRTRDSFSLSTWLRGMACTTGMVVESKSRDADINYFQSRALSTGSTPGSYLVPTIQSDRIIEMLSDYGVLRQIGPTIWPMDGRQKLDVPLVTAMPSVEWLGQNTASNASDVNLGPLSFDLKTARCLSAVPNELVRSSSPAIDALLERILSVAFGEAEDTAFFKATNTTNGPGSVYAASSTTPYFVGNSANGGTLAYSDLIATMRESREVKTRGPYVWAMSPSAWFDGILSMLDGNSRPIAISDVQAAVAGRLFGYPVYLSANIPENISNGSSTNQTYALFTNPAYLHIAEPRVLEIAVSNEFYFDKNQLAVRGVKQVDFGFAPSSGIVLLKGIDT